ncbi:(2Fe-2S)-binding protein [uncultured Thiohalocapsa sp.]|uniref:(2Fe-2S)-binding protein n=1 Tax=uncultured Thiohalocapsa sp. TaxID=768990 RepID=UPI0025D67506|nr:(2Fe-2S)-binding protein [uncultured Thiohalocapsa sp.]
MYVCVCNKVTDSQIRTACENGAHSMECLQRRLKVATCCGRCAECAQRMLNDATAARPDQQLHRVAA